MGRPPVAHELGPRQGARVARDFSSLSIRELRERLLDGPEGPSAQLLAKLKRDRRRGAQQLYEIIRRRFERDREETLRLDAMLNFERILWRSGVQRIAGVDESGMGPLAGPVVAAAVVFAPDVRISGVDDSKRLDAEQRDTLAALIREKASGVSIGLVDVDEIDRVNIYHAGLLAMRRAVEGLPEPPQHVLVDARTIPGITVPQNPFQRGDGLNFSIAAASIIAKTYRDGLMAELDRRYPGYGFLRHKGYGTAEHQRTIRELGPSPVHRKSFPYIREVLGECSEVFYDLKSELDAARSLAALQALEDRIDSRRAELGIEEQRKLRILITRRWKGV